MPLMSVVIVFSIAGIFCSCIMFGFGKVVIFPGCGILELYTFLCNIINKSSVASIVVGQPKVTIIIVYYAILLVVLFGLKNIRTKYTRAEKERNIIKKETGLVLEKKAKKERRIKGQNVKLRLACIVGFLLLNCLIYYIPNQGFYITFIDVGQGDGILIHGDNGMKVMVDGGSTSEKQVAKNCIVPYLKAEGIGTIDYSIITHTDKDHISGILEILENNNSNRIRIKNLVMPDINMKDDTYNELIEKAKLHPCQIVVIGCSTSEICGSRIGSDSRPEVAEQVFAVLHRVLTAHGLYLAAQCCEHLNRAIIIEREAVPGADIVNVVPQPKAGGSFATAAYHAFRDPVAVESIRADAGLDIGGTLIGMHLKQVAVPVRLQLDHIGSAILLAARVRPKFIGGVRAVYDQDLL